MEVDKNTWQPEAIYCQFFSVRGCMFNLTALFTEEALMREKRIKMKENVSSVRNVRGKFQAEVQKRIDEAINVKKEIQKVNSEIAALRFKRRKREKANMDVDFVNLNADTTENFIHDKQAQQDNQKAIREERVDRYKDKRDEAYEDKHRKNYLSLSRWDFLRSFRAEKESEVQERIRNRR